MRGRRENMKKGKHPPPFKKQKTPQILHGKLGIGEGGGDPLTYIVPQSLWFPYFLAQRNIFAFYLAFFFPRETLSPFSLLGRQTKLDCACDSERKKDKILPQMLQKLRAKPKNLSFSRFHFFVVFFMIQMTSKPPTDRGKRGLLPPLSMVIPSPTFFSFTNDNKDTFLIFCNISPIFPDLSKLGSRCQRAK